MSDQDKTATPSIFDLLERVCDRLDDEGRHDLSRPLRCAFSRGTGGVDLVYVVDRMATAVRREDVVVRWTMAIMDAASKTSTVDECLAEIGADVTGHAV